MRELFVDTSAWDAIADSGDPNHSAALRYRDTLVGTCRLVVTNYILDELFTLLLRNIGYTGTVDFKAKLDALAQKEILKVVWISPEIAEESWAVFKRFNGDKAWSFTDCVSYVVMKQLGISESFAFDHHFSQMGFIRRP